jgi:hypothetical protein
VKIQAWENHEKRKAEMEMKKMEVLLYNFHILIRYLAAMFLILYLIVMAFSQTRSHMTCCPSTQAFYFIMQDLQHNHVNNT